MATAEVAAPLGGRFVLAKQIGSGGMASVRRALDLATGQTVAVKRLLQTSFADAPRFAREAAILRSLDHPAVVRWIAQGELPSGEMYLVLEWLEGEDLRRRLKRSRLDLRQTLALGARVAGALGALHERGIVHRDIKPANLLLCGGDPREAKIIDFGVAGWSAAPDEPTSYGAIVGTPGYMAPEQARGERQIDGRADLFAFGCLLYLCLTGERAFSGEDVLTVLAKVVLSEVASVRSRAPNVPEALDRLVARLLSRARPSSPTRSARTRRRPRSTPYAFAPGATRSSSKS